MSTDLVTWLREQLDADERVARSAAPGPWQYQDIDSVGGGRVCDPTVAIANLLFDLPGKVDPRIRRSVLEAEADATGEHMVRWNPARALCEVDAKRRILGAYQAALDDHDGQGRAWDSDSERARARAATLAEVVKLLAEPYRDRPGYREEWRP